MGLRHSAESNRFWFIWMQNTRHTWKFFRKVYTGNKQKGKKGELLTVETNERRPKNLKAQKIKAQKWCLSRTSQSRELNLTQDIQTVWKWNITSKGLTKYTKLSLDYKQKSGLENHLEWRVSFGINCRHINEPNRTVQTIASAPLYCISCQIWHQLISMLNSAIKWNAWSNIWYNQELAP